MSIKFFNNLLVYRMTEAKAFHSRSDELNELLATKAARMPGPAELSCVGFSEPLGIDDEFVEHIRPQTMTLCVNFAERMLPGKIVRQRVMAKVKEIEDNEERKVFAREKNQIKDAVVAEMLPRAFIDQKHIRVMIIGPYIVIDSTSAKKGEEILSLMRSVLGTLGVRPVSVKTTPIEPFTRWFTGAKLPPKFGLTGDFKANSQNDEIDSLTGKGTSPETEGLSDLVAEYSRRVIVLGMSWTTSMDEKLTFTVNEMIGIKGIKWPDAIMDMAAADAGEEADKVNLMRATMLLLSAEIAQLITDLLDALGGEEIPSNSDWDDDKWMRMMQALGNISHVNGVAVRDLEQAARDSHARVNKIVGGEDSEHVEDDPLYRDALAFVRESGRASISAVQRKLRLGYNRAVRLIERMEEEGAVTAMNSNGSREVIGTATKLQDLTHLLDEELDDEEDVI